MLHFTSTNLVPRTPYRLSTTRDQKSLLGGLNPSLHQNDVFKLFQKKAGWMVYIDTFAPNVSVGSPSFIPAR